MPHRLHHILRAQEVRACQFITRPIGEGVENGGIRLAP